MTASKSTWARAAVTCALFAAFAASAHAQQPGADRPVGPLFAPQDWQQPPAQPQQQPQPLAPPEPEPPSLLETSTWLIDAVVTLGATIEGEFDEVLQSHGFGRSPRMWGGDVTYLRRVLPWLWIGGRTGFRARDWLARLRGPSVAVFAPDALAIAEARVAVNRSIELGACAGLGIGFAGLRVQESTEIGVAPRVHGSGTLGFRIADPARGFFRVGWDWFTLSNVTDLADRLHMGGFQVGVGAEIRQ